MPPSGFLISCARLRTSSLLACACSKLRSSRSSRVCCSISIISTSTRPGQSVCDTITCTGRSARSAPSAFGRCSMASKRPLATSLAATMRSASASGRGIDQPVRAHACGTARGATGRCCLRASHWPSGTGHRGRPGRPSWPAGRRRRTPAARLARPSASLGQLADLALDRRDVGFLAGDAGLHARPRGRGTSGSCARRRAARARRCCIPSAVRPGAALRAAARRSGCGGASLSRSRCAAGSTLASPLRALPEAGGGVAAGARGLGVCTIVIGAPSIVRQPLSRASCAVSASV